MTDDELIAELKALGIDESSHKVLSLLPLVHVGWADGRIQRGEREAIKRIAADGGMLEGDGALMLDGWLAKQPDPSYLERGFRVLAELASRREGIGNEMNAETLDEVVGFCVDVARAAGGLFGIGAIARSEHAALAEIAGALRIEHGVSWDEMLADLKKSNLGG